MIIEQRRSRAVAVLISILIGLGTGWLPTPAAAHPSVPRPVYAPTDFEAADPGIATDGRRFMIFSTGGLARTASADTVQGRWDVGAEALSRWPSWAADTGAVWAPDVTRTETGWVLYFAMIASDFDGQRCIGTATAETITGPYLPSDRPLICPVLDGEDPVADRPVPGSGVIDPAPFTDADGTRYLLYKTQQAPGTIRLVQLSSDGLHVTGRPSAELIRHDDSIENPVLVKRGDQYVLFASANWYDQCRYSTVWRRSPDLWSFADKTEQILLDQANTGLCGPGGADVVASNGSVDDTAVDRMILHGWVCGDSLLPCTGEGPVTDPTKRRVVYAAALTWGDDGATPNVPHFLPPARGS